MFRVVLAIYTLMLSLMGPAPCCCTVVRVAATALSAFGMEHYEPACCQEQCVGGREDNSDDDPSQEMQEPTKHCQCVKNVCEAVPASSTGFTVDTSRSWFDGLALDLVAPVMLDAEVSSFVVVCPDRTPRATLSGREIRVAIQSWVC